MKQKHDTHGLLAEFNSAEQLLEGVRCAHAAGFRKMDAYSPFEVEGLHEALGGKPSLLPALILGGGASGAVLGFGMQYFAAAIHYPLNVGGRPLNSWPAFIPITFELTILFAGVIGVIALI